MSFQVSFIFGGISSEYDGSISSLTHIISSYLALAPTERPFSVKHLYHLSRDDGLVRTFPFHSTFTISEIQTYISDTSRPGRTLPDSFDGIRSCNEYIVNLLPGQFGEDGGVQTLAALFGLKGTFGDPQVASLVMNKYAMSSFVSSLFPTGTVKSPKTKLVKQSYSDKVIQIANSVEGPIVVKPNSLGSSLLTEVFESPSGVGSELCNIVDRILKYDSTALIQKFIPGDDYSCGCIVTSSRTTILPVVRIETERDFFGHAEKEDSKLSNKTIVDRDDVVSDRLKSATRLIASAVGIHSIGRFDFKVTSASEIYFLECNCIPGLSQDSIFTKMLLHEGMTVIDLILLMASHSYSFIRKPHLIE
ncbi:D-alanine--D-alanine ligase [Mesorhizobium sp. M0514]|uniref:D-alanine--D-alanine ligase n=1 Tax=Mesorhizobium sp. M0514 TaxID=2956955 RepID=UPI00333B5CC9